MSARTEPARYSAEQTDALAKLRKAENARQAAEAAELEALAEAYRSGFGSTTLARLLNLDERTTRKRLRAAGVELDRKGRAS